MDFKKAKFKVINGGLSENKATSEYGKRVQEIKRKRPELADVDLSNSNNLDVDSFQFLFREVFEPAYQEKQILSLENEIQKEELFYSRLNVLLPMYSDVEIDFNNLAVLSLNEIDFRSFPLEFREKLFAPPLRLLDNGSFIFEHDDT